ncbi:MAG: LysE family transporter [Saprospiraceae bacterium]
MLEIFTYSIITGVILSFGFGTVFFSLIQTSIESGYKSGIKLAFGVFISDIILMLVAIFGTQFLPDQSSIYIVIRILCALIILALAYTHIFHKTKPTISLTDNIVNFFYLFSKGFVLNIINPVNFLAWVALVATLKSYHVNWNIQSYSLTIVLCTIFVSECAISIFSEKLGKLLNPNKLKILKTIIGIIFLLLAIKIFYSIFQDFYY